MGIKMKTLFYPFRLVIARREPVQLSLTILNDCEEERRLTVKLQLPEDLSFTKGGFKNSELKRVDFIGPGEKKILYFEIYPKPTTRAGEHSIKIKVQEHTKDYRFTSNQYEETAELMVE